MYFARKLLPYSAENAFCPAPLLLLFLKKSLTEICYAHAAVSGYEAADAGGAPCLRFH